MISNSGSENREKSSLCPALNSDRASTESALQPTTVVWRAVNFFIASRNSDASLVQPGVLAFGKKYRRRFCSRKSASDTVRPSSVAARKAGALAPVLSAVVVSTRRNQGAGGQDTLEDFVDKLWIGLAARFAHDLSNKVLEDALVPCAILGCVVGTACHHCLGDSFNRASVVDLRHSLGRDDIRRTLACFEHRREHPLSARSSDLAPLDPSEKFGERSRSHRAIGDIFPGII